MNFTKTLLLVTLLAISANAYGAGGWTEQRTTPANKQLVAAYMKKTTQGQNGELTNLLVQDFKWYGTQVVAGINHAVVFSNPANGQLTCVKMWEKLDGSFEITNQGVSANSQDLEAICGFKGIN